MDYHVEIQSKTKTPKVIQLYDALEAGIHSGKLSPGFQLPSITRLAGKLSISRDTVEKAYRNLREDGYLESVPDRGYFVRETRPVSSEQVAGFMANLLKELHGIKQILNDIGQKSTPSNP